LININMRFLITNILYIKKISKYIKIIFYLLRIDRVSEIFVPENSISV